MSSKPQILLRLFYVGALFVVARLIGAGRDMMIAYQYGTGEIVDAYVLVFGLLMWVPAVWVNLTQASVVPSSSRLSPEQRSQFHRGILACSVILAVAATLAAALLLPLLLSHLTRDSASVVGSLSNTFALYLCPLIGVGILVATLAALLLTRQKPGFTLLEALPPLGVILTLLVWAGTETGPLVAGSLIGFGLQLLGMWLLARRLTGSTTPSFRSIPPAIKLIWQGMSVMLLGQLFMTATQPIDQMVALGLGEGEVARLAYANRVVSFVNGVGSVAVIRALMPMFAHTSHAGEGKANEVWHWTGILAAAGMVASLALWGSAELVTQALFQRGAFTPADTLLVATLIETASWQIAPFLGGLVIIQYAIAQRCYGVVASLAAVTALVKITGTLLLSRWYGTEGIVLSSVLMYATSFTLAGAWLLHRRFRKRF